MTKAELIKALKDFPDDMEVKIAFDPHDFWFDREVENVVEDNQSGTEEPYILLK